MPNLPSLDPRVERRSISQLHSISTPYLRGLAERNAVCVVHRFNEPLAVIVPFRLYREFQEKVAELEALEKDIEREQRSLDDDFGPEIPPDEFTED